MVRTKTAGVCRARRSGLVHVEQRRRGASRAKRRRGWRAGCRRRSGRIPAARLGTGSRSAPAGPPSSGGRRTSAARPASRQLGAHRNEAGSARGCAARTGSRLQVVELALAVLVLDVLVARGAHGACRRRRAPAGPRAARRGRSHARGRAASGSSERPSTRAPAWRPAAARMVGARSTLATSWRRRRRAGKPGRGGAAARGSTARRAATCRRATRCSPWKKPLSEVKTISVRSSSPVGRRASTMPRHRLVDRQQRLELLAVVLAHDRRAPAHG